MDEGVTDGETPAAYAAPTCQPAALASVLPSANAVLSPAFQLAPPIIFPQPSDQHQIAHKGVQHANLQQQLQAFWSDKLSEINQTTKFNLNGLPLKGIKKIMKTDGDVQRISGDAPVFFAKACEMFIQELTLQAWHHTKQNKRMTLQRKDISVALATTEVFDFLVGISPLNKLEPEGAGLPADTLLSPPPEVTVELKGNGMGLLRMNSVQPPVLQGNAVALPLAPPPTTNKAMPSLHLENFKPVQNYVGSNPRTIDHNQVSFKHHHVFLVKWRLHRSSNTSRHVHSRWQPFFEFLLRKFILHL